MATLRATLVKSCVYNLLRRAADLAMGLHFVDSEQRKERVRERIGSREPVEASAEVILTGASPKPNEIS
jgi:hypothetical protein